MLDAVGAQATRALGLELLRPGGTMVCIGLAADDTTLGFHDVVRSQHRIQGSYAYTMPDFEQAHEWLVSGQATLGDDLTAVRPLDDGPGGSSRGSRAARRRPSSRSSWRRGREREPHGRRHRRLVRHRPRDRAGVRATPATPCTPPRGARSTSRASTAHRLDFTDRDAVAAFAARFERVDALIVAAGTNIKERRLHELTPESWDHLIGANLTGPFYALHAFLPALKPRAARS